MRYASKTELMDDIAKEWDKLWEMLDSIDFEQLPKNQSAAYKTSDASVDPDSSPSVNWTVREVLAHIHGWHKLLQSWLKASNAGKAPVLPGKGFNWRQTKALNRTIANDLSEYDYKQLRKKLKASHRSIMKLIDPLSEREMIERRVFAWTGNNALVSYVGPNMAGHYRWGQKKLKGILKEFLE